MPAHSRPKDGVASLAYVAGIHVLATKQGVDGRAFASPKRLRPRRRDKPGHDGVIQGKRRLCARSVVVIRSHHSANAPQSRGFEFGRPGRPALSLFPSLSQEVMERREAPWSVRGSIQAGFAISQPPRQASGTQVLRVVGVPGRAGPSEEPCASRRSNAMPLSGTAPCCLFERRDRRRP